MYKGHMGALELRLFVPSQNKTLQSTSRSPDDLPHSSLPLVPTAVIIFVKVFHKSTNKKSATWYSSSSPLLSLS